MACGDDGETGGGGDAPTSTSTTQTSSSQSSATGASMNGTAFERAAIVYASCFPESDANEGLRSLEGNLDFSGAPLDAYIQCMAAVTGGCAEAYQCGLAFSNDGDDCPTTCNGDILTGCDDSWRFTADCTKLGLKCLGNTCLPEGATPCADGTPDACDGDVATSCNGGYVRRRDCATDGQTCAVDDSDPTFIYAYCKSGDTPCAGAMPGCNGAAIETCDYADNVLSTPCGAGETCHEVGTIPFCGTGDACDPYGEPTCNGTKITACHDGVVVEIDCAPLGFTSCVSTAGQVACGPGV